MNLTYQLTNSDFLEYQLYISSTSETHKKKRFRSRVITPVIYMLFGLCLYPINRDYFIVFFFVGFAVMWFLIYPKYSKWRYKNHFKKHVDDNYKNRINIPIEINFSENNIQAKDYVSESKINGKELKELIETKMHFFLKLKTDVSLIIPKQAIENQTELKNHILKLGAVYVDALDWEWK